LIKCRHVPKFIDGTAWFSLERGIAVGLLASLLYCLRLRQHWSGISPRDKILLYVAAGGVFYVVRDQLLLQLIVMIIYQNQI